MGFNPFHISVANTGYVVLGGFTVFFGMFSLLVREKLYIGEAILAFVFGIIVGPFGANIFNPRGWANDNPETVSAITLEVTRVVLAVGVFAIGVELPSKYMQKHVKSLLFLLGPIMTVGWAVCAGLIYALIPKLDFLSSLAVAACLTPTDPILASAVVGGRYAEKHVPEHLRHLLMAESGCNDGAAFPFLFIAIYLILEKDDRVAVAKWFYITWVYEIILGIAIGCLLGYGFRHLMKFCEDRDLIDRKSYVAQYISLALLSDGITSLLGSDDLLAAFCSGSAFAWDSHFNQQTEDSVFSSVIDLLFNVAVFIFIGAWMPFDQFSNIDTSLEVWRLVVLGILVLLLRRLPIILALYKFIPDIQSFREALFSGHFGPMGVGAIFIATLGMEKLPHPHHPPENQTDVLALSMEPIIAFMIMCSILIHGMSIPFFSLGRRVHSVTFSRTMSMRGHHEPEWAAHTRKVSRPEDIVVNRDPTTIEKVTEEGRVTPSANATTPSGTDAAKELAVKEYGVNDDESIREWREGRHLILEHHSKKPGRDVRVEVIRDAFARHDSSMPDLSGIRHTFRATEAAIRDEVLKILGAISPRPSFDHHGVEEQHNEPASRSTGDQLQVPSRNPSREGRARDRSPEGTVPRSVPEGRHGNLPEGDDDDDDEGDRVGRPLTRPSIQVDLSPNQADTEPTISTDSAPGPSATGSAINQRIQRLRFGDDSVRPSPRGSRESSPVRTIRFAATPQPQESRPGTPPVEEEEEQTPATRISPGVYKPTFQ